MNLREILNKDISFSGNKLNDAKKKEIIGNLAILLRTGINIKDSLEIILNDYASDKNSKKVLEELSESIKKGSSFAQAIENTKAFKKYEIFNIKIGEETGQLTTTVMNLSDYLTRNIELRRKIVSAMSYPAIVLITAILAVSLMLNFVVPMFEDIFSRFGHELPMLTKVIIDLSDNTIWFLLAIAIIVPFIIIQNKILQNNIAYQSVKSKLLLKIPVVGDLLRNVHLARFAAAMELFIYADIPVHKAIVLIREMNSFYPLTSALINVEDKLMKGNSFYEAIGSQAFFDRRIVAMVKVGMETNKLNEIFKISKENYYDDISYKASVLNSLLEPIMIVFIGIIVGVILIGMYLPIFKLSMSFDL